MNVTIIVLDSLGVGALPDADAFGDVGSHTLNHILEHTDIKLPHLVSLGLGCVPTVDLPKTDAALGSYGRMREVSQGKDTSTGHWEFMGIQLESPFRTFGSGFPTEVIDAFEKAIGRPVLCNQSYSGTEVIRDYGILHAQTGKPIVYTSADSVFQIAAHTDVVSIETLYDWCQTARNILQGEYAVARVIARPFAGEYPFERVSSLRKDFSLHPPRTVLNALQEAGKDVIAVGKIGDIFDHSGITQEIHTGSNAEGIEQTLRCLKSDFNGLLFTNLVDFDAKYGHRRDPQGYAKALVEFDQALPELLAAVKPGDLLMLVSDHGNDPTWFGSDHTREYAMLLAYRAGQSGVDLGERDSFADLGATVADALGVSWKGPGKSFWPLLNT